MNIPSGSKAILLFLFLLACPVWVYSQNRQIDSLNQLLKVKREVPVLCALARENIMLENFEPALQLADEALVIGSKEGDSLGIVMAHRYRGVVFRNREQFEEALHEIIPAFGIAKRHSFLKDMKYLLNAMAIIYTNQAHYDRALDYNFQSLAIREAEGDQLGVSVSLNNIGFVYYKLKDYKNAYTYYGRSLKLKREINDVYDEEIL